MSLEFRQATETDAPALAALKQLVWPQEAAPTLANIVNALRAPGHVTHVATAADEVVGFVSGFITTAENGSIRWEVDLLAVHPDYRGQQIGVRLIQRSTEIGQALHAHLARGLVAVDNVASQQAFRRSGYQVEPTRYTLLIATAYSATQAAAEPIQPSPGLFIVPVQTLTYHGAWLEGAVTRAGLHAAQARQAAEGWAVVGVLLPSEHLAEQVLAETLGFTAVGVYQWWTK